MSSPENKRKSVRVPVQLDIQIEHQHHTTAGTVLNCSIDGMFIKTTETFQINEVVKVSFELPGSKDRTVLRSRVMWCHSVEGTGSAILGLGIRFEHLTPEQGESIRRFIDQILNS